MRIGFDLCLQSGEIGLSGVLWSEAPIDAGGGEPKQGGMGQVLGFKPLAHDVFDHFPHGILVFEPAGDLVAANRAASKFLGPLRRMPDGNAPRCCDLFGCNVRGVLRGVCLAELAAQTPVPPPDMRVDLDVAAPGDAVWLTLAPLIGQERRFLVEIRAADPRDRRRRTEPHWMGERRLHICALGRTRVESREGPMKGRWLEQRAGQVLKYLICERSRVVYPEEIAAAIWPNEGAGVTGTVRYFVHRLRRHLEPEPPGHGPSSFIIAAEGGYRLSPAVHVDADEFERELTLGLDASSAGDERAAREHLEQALALYQGDLIADHPHAAWAFEERERLRALAEEGLHQLAKLDLDRDDLESALERLRRLVQLDPYDLRLHRWLLTLCLVSGRRSEALRRYKLLKAKLREELDEEPDFELADLDMGGGIEAIRQSNPWSPVP